MADPGRRASCTALSNTITGVPMLAAGIFGIVDQLFGEVAILPLFTLLRVAAVWMAAGLEEVQHD